MKSKIYRRKRTLRDVGIAEDLYLHSSRVWIIPWGKVIVEQQLAILRCQDRLVEVMTTQGNIRIIGKSLSLQEMAPHGLSIVGQIDCIQKVL